VQRLRGLDIIRGVGIIGVVFLHSATFHYEGITAIDFSHPPLLITVIGFLLMWAGLFAVVSSAAYAYASACRVASGGVSAAQLLPHFWVSGGVLLVLHYIYFVFLGPRLLDVVHGAHQDGLLPGLIASGVLPPVTPERFFYSTTLSMIGWNLVLIGPLLSFLASEHGLGRMRRNGVVLGALGTAVMLGSIARIPLYSVAVRAIETGDDIASLFWGFLVNKNNPILPYLAFGLFGTWLGLALARRQNLGRVLGSFAMVGLLWLTMGLAGLFLLPDTMLQRDIDLYWYFITVFQLGLFLMIVTAVLAVADVSRVHLVERYLVPVRRMGMVSLSVFMFETVLSQILVRAGDALFPGWRMQIVWCLVFGGVNALLWVGIVAVWARCGFCYSIEWLVGRVYAWFKRPSEKMRAQESLTLWAGNEEASQ
jgi:hypothetical protein